MKNLGLYVPPDDSTEPQFSALRERVDEWTNNVANSGLPTRSVWKSYQFQLWSGMKYGIGASPATIKELENGLGTRDHKLLSYLGVCKNIAKEWRYLPPNYGGIGLHNLLHEATSASLNVFLQHYSTDTSLGHFLTASIENLQLELGVAGCPFKYDFDIWGELATNSWVKSLWERIHHFKIDIEMDYPTLKPPRENDECIMEKLVKQGVRGSELVCINRVRKHQESIFTSDIATAKGTRVDPIYFNSWHDSYERVLGKRRSRFIYGEERPSEGDWKVWRKKLSSRTPGHQLVDRDLGQWKHPSPRIWRSFWNEGSISVDLLADNGDVLNYKYAQVRTYLRDSNHSSAAAGGVPVTIGDVSEHSLRIAGIGTALAVQEPEEDATSFVEYLKSWGGEWMWEDLRMCESSLE